MAGPVAIGWPTTRLPHVAPHVKSAFLAIFSTFLVKSALLQHLQSVHFLCIKAHFLHLKLGAVQRWFSTLTYANKTVRVSGKRDRV